MYGLLVLNLIVPFVMILVGYSFKKHPVTDMNSGNGYNTPTSRKSQEHWDYAQSIALAEAARHALEKPQPQVGVVRGCSLTDSSEVVAGDAVLQTLIFKILS